MTVKMDNLLKGPFDSPYSVLSDFLHDHLLMRGDVKNFRIEVGFEEREQTGFIKMNDFDDKKLYVIERRFRRPRKSGEIQENGFYHMGDKEVTFNLKAIDGGDISKVD